MPKTAFKIFFFIALVHFGFTAATPHIANQMLRMKVREIVKEDGRRSESYIQDEILEYASDKGIPLTGNHVSVWRQKDGEVHIWIEYARTVSIPYKPYDVELTVAHPPGTLPRGSASRIVR